MFFPLKDEDVSRKVKKKGVISFKFSSSSEDAESDKDS